MSRREMVGIEFAHRLPIKPCSRGTEYFCHSASRAQRGCPEIHTRRAWFMDSRRRGACPRTHQRVGAKRRPIAGCARIRVRPERHEIHDYLMEENGVGASSWLESGWTIGPPFSVSARLEIHSGSAMKAFHFCSRSASDSHASM